jgi:hypothetical protein
MKKGVLIGMGTAFTIAGITGYMLYKNMDRDTKRGLTKAVNRKKRQLKSDIENMM